jgi:predicted permease
MGASPRRLLAQLLTESILLGLAGGFAGLLLAVVGIKLLAIGCAHYFQMPGTQWISLDGHVFIFSFVIAVLSGILFGLAPALQASGTDVNEPLKEGSLTTTVEFGRRRLRNGLVVCEVALAVILMTGAGLLIHSFVNMLNVDLGFNPSHLLVCYFQLPNYKYKTDVQKYDFFHELLGRVRGLPGVRNATFADAIPLAGNGVDFLFVPEGQPRPAPGQEPEANLAPVSPGFFKTIGTPLVEGWDFSAADDRDVPAVAIINQALASRYFAGKNPIGRRLVVLSNIYGDQNLKGSNTLQIVGVAGNYMRYDLRNDGPLVFVPFAQDVQDWTGLIVGTALPPGALVPAVRDAVWRIDKEQPIGEITTADHVVNETLGFYRFPMTVVWIFAGLALMLAAVGIFGVISYSVSQRSHEMAIRMALGGQRRDVMRLVVGEGLRFTLAGLAIGIVAALMLSRFVASFLYGVHASDPLTFISVGLVMLVVAVLAAFVPARRATRVDPIVTLRYE